MIELEGVRKSYRTERTRKVVLRDVTGALDTHRAYGLLGANGAGKSTFLRLLAGSELPDRGRIRRRGRISWPLGFSGGFHPQMTGRDNVVFLARAYGADIQEVVEFAQDFAQIGAYFEAEVRTYSSGMMARLAFAVSMAVDFDFYLIDEITAVGDERFAARCHKAFEERRERSGLILASHSVGTIKDYCRHGLVLEDGELLYFDAVDDAIAHYRRRVLA